VPSEGPSYDQVEALDDSPVALSDVLGEGAAEGNAAYEAVLDDGVDAVTRASYTVEVSATVGGKVTYSTPRSSN
jgi:hypothetical protein